MTTTFDWAGAGFVVTPGNVPTTLVPTWIRTLFIQVAHGLQPLDVDEAKLRELEAAGFLLGAWAWANGDNVAAEAELHAELALPYRAFVANLEEPYDAHGDSSLVEYDMPTEYLLELSLGWDGPLGLTTTATFASDMTRWREAGAVFMPQAFPLAVEGGSSVSEVLAHANAWGWPNESVRPLVQAYRGVGNERPDPALMNADATGLGVGVIPYTVEQAAADPPAGLEWLEAMRPSIERPTPGSSSSSGGEGGNVATLIGSQHGVTAAVERLRVLDPGGTKPNRNPNDLATWGAYDKLERTLSILAADHDELIRTGGLKATEEGLSAS